MPPYSVGVLGAGKSQRGVHGASPIAGKVVSRVERMEQEQADHKASLLPPASCLPPHTQAVDKKQADG
ncbi:hypothetical protein [Undibacterium umbellatum]|uniref:Uncharacterized protein n=1 Tax=Undibacterium umbellatum TaxID=2762300 RepID=A0ABR6Z8N2_9BURK|nr:hypothetical protein [Undibacterium umbellatum]MBC3908127.1 hypothetical protein [Undibacterium umbellatum]